VLVLQRLVLVLQRLVPVHRRPILQPCRTRHACPRKRSMIPRRENRRAYPLVHPTQAQPSPQLQRTPFRQTSLWPGFLCMKPSDRRTELPLQPRVLVQLLLEVLQQVLVLQRLVLVLRRLVLVLQVLVHRHHQDQMPCKTRRACQRKKSMLARTESHHAYPLARPAPPQPWAQQQKTPCHKTSPCLDCLSMTPSAQQTHLPQRQRLVLQLVLVQQKLVSVGLKQALLGLQQVLSRCHRPTQQPCRRHHACQCK